MAAGGSFALDPSEYISAAPGGGMQKTINEIAGSAAVAKSFNLPMISYEGGQSIIRYDGKNRLQAGRDDKIVEFITLANKDPRMEKAYDLYLNVKST